MAETALVARSPIRQAPPVEISEGWEVSARPSDAALRLADASPLAKWLLRGNADGEGPVGVPLGRARRSDGGPLVVGTRPGQWTVIGEPGAVRAAAEHWPGPAVDLTHGVALLRLTGGDAPGVLAKLCAIDLDPEVTPDGAAFASSVAKVVADVVRDDVAGERSYLLACDRSYGQYLFDEVLEAGRAEGLEAEGFGGWR